MPIATWLRYLIGDRVAILQCAQHPQALWIGALFVLSAGLAREYDAEDLLHEPWHLLIPFAASLLTSFVLYAVAMGLLKFKGGIAPGYWSGYRSFLALFWLTAPLAWLYAIPFERFLDPLDAVLMNLGTLAIVSAWRVALMVRVLHVVMDYRIWQALFLVMLLADAEVLLALQIVPRPIWQTMGGIRLSPTDAALAEVGANIKGAAVLSALVWVIGAAETASRASPSWQAWHTEESVPVGRGLAFLAVGAVALWAAILPFTQPEQQLRYRVEQALKNGRIAEALAEMSAHNPTDFPPLWDPPPRVAYEEMNPPMNEILEAIRRQPPAAWVIEVFHEKDKALGNDYRYRD